MQTVVESIYAYTFVLDFSDSNNYNMDNVVGYDEFDQFDNVVDTNNHNEIKRQGLNWPADKGL
jgi:hypothetical protein